MVIGCSRGAHGITPRPRLGPGANRAPVQRASGLRVWALGDQKHGRYGNRRESSDIAIQSLRLLSLPGFEFFRIVRCFAALAGPSDLFTLLVLARGVSMACVDGVCILWA